MLNTHLSKNMGSNVNPTFGVNNPPIWKTPHNLSNVFHNLSRPSPIETCFRKGLNLFILILKINLPYRLPMWQFNSNANNKNLCTLKNFSPSSKHLIQIIIREKVILHLSLTWKDKYYFFISHLSPRARAHTHTHIYISSISLDPIMINLKNRWTRD
jgi:hypothetical protein